MLSKNESMYDYRVFNFYSCICEVYLAEILVSVLWFHHFYTLSYNLLDKTESNRGDDRKFACWCWTFTSTAIVSTDASLIWDALWIFIKILFRNEYNKF